MGRLEADGLIMRKYTHEIERRLSEIAARLLTAEIELEQLRTINIETLLDHDELIELREAARRAGLALSTITDAHEMVNFLREVLHEHAHGNSDDAIATMGIERPQRKKTPKKTFDPRETQAAEVVKSSSTKP